MPGRSLHKSSKQKHGAGRPEVRRRGPGCGQRLEAARLSHARRKGTTQVTLNQPPLHPFVQGSVTTSLFPRTTPPQNQPCQGWGRTTASCQLLESPKVGCPCCWERLPEWGSLQDRMSWQGLKASPGQAHTSESQGQAPGGQSAWAAVSWPARQYLQQHTPHVGLHVLGAKLAQQELCRQPLGHEVGHPVAIVAVEDPIQEAVVLTPGRERGRR